MKHADNYYQSMRVDVRFIYGKLKILHNLDLRKLSRVFDPVTEKATEHNLVKLPDMQNTRIINNNFKPLQVFNII